ncbi:MAG: metal ABC transporter permease [Epsilonproteobacteria bacterium]|nr:metal ABC transporter permease [Campylobacterota bacterium]
MWDLIGNSLIAAALLSVAIGIIGSLILINRATSITGSISHGSFGGVGIGIYYGLNINLSITLFTLFLALLLSFITLRYKHRSESLIGVIWALGMSIGILFLNMAPGYNADALSYLFGNILLISKTDLLWMGVIDIILILAAFVLYNRFLAMSYDIEFLKVRGINTHLLHTIFLILTSLTIVMSVKSIGIILILALYTIPPLIAEKFTKNLLEMMIAATLLAAAFIFSGIYISYRFDLSPTPIIVIIAAVSLFLSMVKRN